MALWQKGLTHLALMESDAVILDVRDADDVAEPLGVMLPLKLFEGVIVPLLVRVEDREALNVFDGEAETLLEAVALNV